uniref:Uncharacterized protein n=1 Tax=Anguilla anguilla TaxID=7936 RepID=A0A0E9VCQ8_ANGAN
MKTMDKFSVLLLALFLELYSYKDYVHGTSTRMKATLRFR